MSGEKKSADGRGVPPGAEGATAEPKPQDARMIPGGSFAAARRPVGVNAMDHYEEAPVIKADLPDLSETPGWNMVPKADRRA
jgi:hypothetical protein